MIGISLPYKKLLSDDGTLNTKKLLPELREKGARSIELRTVSFDACPEDIRRVAEILWDHGFEITVHSKCRTVQSAVDDVFAPLSLVLDDMLQRELIVTVHPVVGDNAEMVTALSDHIISNKYPVKIALENNRRMPDGKDGNSAELVLDAVKCADRKNVGICFDMGHWAWYTENFTDSPNKLPPKEFLSRTIHTHIHAYSESVTHFPLDTWRAPFSIYIMALGFKYTGVYNIELEPERFAHRWSAEEGYLISVDNMKAHYPSRAEYYDELREHYDGWFLRSLDVLRKEKGCYGSLIAPSSYLFSTNEYKWGMDISFQMIYEVAETPYRVREFLGGLDCIFITHSHEDHMEEETIRALIDTNIIWVVPSFLVEDMIRFDVRRELIVSVDAGDDISVGALRVRVTEGRHFRPDTKKGIASVGYVISADNAPTIAFPGDVRDYGIMKENELNADHCFGHVWLTDEALDPDKYIPKAEEFAEFMLSNSRKSILLAHLYSDRSEDKRWTLMHARIVREKIHKRSPETKVYVPRYGEVFEL